MNKKEIHLEMSLILEINEGQFCLRCPAGGPDLEKSRFKKKKKTKVSFVPVALRAAPTLKNRDFLKINVGQFCLCCPAGSPDLENHPVTLGIILQSTAKKTNARKKKIIL